jgi:hypothetical protein
VDAGTVIAAGFWESRTDNQVDGAARFIFTFLRWRKQSWF